MAAHGADALLVCGSEYSGFEGAVRYLSGFRIVHRYAYVLLPAAGDAITIFPSEARWVGDHADGWIEDPIFAEHPGAWIRDHLRAQGVRRLAVHGHLRSHQHRHARDQPLLAWGALPRHQHARKIHRHLAMLACYSLHLIHAPAIKLSLKLRARLVIRRRSRRLM